MSDATGTAPTTPEEMVAALDAQDPREALLLSLADDELVTGHRSSHWTGVAPGMEEDLAFATLSQDEINHADLWYQVLVGSDDRHAVDRLGLGRRPDEYRHAVLCERPPTDFAYTLARHWLYDHFDALRLDVLSESSDPDVAAVAAKLRHEERYHLEHADHWLGRLLAGGDEARQRIAGGLERAWPEALWLFEPLPQEEALVADGILATYSAQLLLEWLEVMIPPVVDAGIGHVLPEPLVGDAVQGGWSMPTDAAGSWVLPDGFFARPGGRRGVHTADWTDDAWPEMTALYRAHPGARW